mgnify:FL=1
MNKITHIIFFDGPCNLCNSLIDFIIKRDKKKLFYFASLQSETAEKMLKDQVAHEQLMDSVVYVNGDMVYSKSTAVVEIFRQLKFPYNLIWLGVFVPKPIRDFIYDLIARNRYRWFGRQKICRIPTKEEEDRFLK